MIAILKVIPSILLDIAAAPKITYVMPPSLVPLIKNNF